MGNSLRDQLFQAGLVTEEQIKETVKTKPETARQNKKPTRAKQKKHKQSSELAKFYKQRADQERQEKLQQEQQRREAARLKKERREKIAKLIQTHSIANEEGDIRYNFVVGKTVKYIFVSEEQQQQLSAGKLAITFMGGKRILIPHDTGKEIQSIDPDKIVIF